MLGQDEHEIDTKNRTLMNSASELTNPLEMVKKHVLLWNRTILMFELGVRSKLRCWAKISIRQTRKSGFNELSFRAHEPLRNGKKTIQASESLNFDVPARS